MNNKYRPLWIGAVALVVSPFALQTLGLTLTSFTDVVIFAIAALGLNLLVGYTGLTSFGHGASFGIGANAAALSQKYWFPGQIVPPALFALAFVELLTLALSALTYAIAFRWTAFTGGESRLGGVVRPAVGPLNLDDSTAYLVLVSLIGFAVLFMLLRVVRSPFGHVLVAIRENEQRATFQGYDTDKYKLVVFVLTATVTALAGVLLVFHHRLASADPTSVAFSGELLVMVVIGGIRSFLGPVLGALFYILFRELLSIWTPNWLLWFGLAFVGFIMYSPNGLVGISERLQRRWRLPPEEGAAMSQRQIHEGLPLPDFLRPAPRQGVVLEVAGIGKHFGGIQAVREVQLSLQAGQIQALIGPNGAGKTTTFNMMQGRGLFSGMTVTENLALSRLARATDGRGGTVWSEDKILQYFPQLRDRMQTPADFLSGGEQQMVAVARALSGNVRLLLLDEPFEGLAPTVVQELFSVFDQLRQELSIVIVEHNLDLVLALADRVFALERGAVFHTGPAQPLLTDLA